jgi:hypothetical protein
MYMCILSTYTHTNIKRNDFAQEVTSSVMAAVTEDVRERINPTCLRNITSPGFSLAMPCKDTTSLCDPGTNTELETSELLHISLVRKKKINKHEEENLPFYHPGHFFLVFSH